MPSDFSVFTRLINETHESLSLDSDHLVAEHGDWYDVPKSIGAGESKRFSLQGRLPAFYGCEGEFTYRILDTNSRILSKLWSYQVDPIQSGNNVKVRDPKPEALYTVSFQTSTKGPHGPWTEGKVNPDGHPFWVEYTVKYQPRTYFFLLIHISASSFHIVRNTRRKLVYGTHSLWDSKDPNAFNDGNQGSYQPNIFEYDFVSPVAIKNAIDVTVRPVDLELEGAEAVVVGRINNARVFLSEWFILKVNADQKVTTRIISPNTSTMPFAWNDDVQWSLELRYSDRPVMPLPGTPSSTRLELYWIASHVHFAFKNEIPVGFLRDVLRRAPRQLEWTESGSSNLKASDGPVGVRTSGYYQYVTNAVFGDFCKKYDTVTGASHFNMDSYGGFFAQGRYRLADASGVPGSRIRAVNCMDQAAMLELSCSFWQEVSDPRPTSWLLQCPFGYINTTHLVGITQSDFSGPLIPVNNPFFGTDRSKALLDINDTSRSWFSCHVYVGYSSLFDRVNDGVFDACSGPHTGTENAESYVTAAIDTQTNLYHVHNTHPGTVASIQQSYGVIGIDGHSPTSAHNSRSGLNLTPFRQLLDRLAPVPNAGTVTQVDWANLSDWVESVLGDEWSVVFGSVTASEDIADAFWDLADAANPDDPVCVHVIVPSVAGTDGALDVAASAEAARDRLATILSSTDRDPEGVWTTGTFNDFGDYSLQYAADLAAGRVIVVAANTVVDIAGRSSTNALDRVARQLFGHTVRSDAPALSIPVLEYRGDGDTLTVHGLGTEFTIVFAAVGQLSVAGATCEDTGVVFDDSLIVEVEGGNSTVEFKFVTRELGEHAVRIHCADMLTMVCATKTLRVNVMEDDANA